MPCLADAEYERAHRVDFESYPAPDEVAIHVSIRQ